jgi:hypothetical protein
VGFKNQLPPLKEKGKKQRKKKKGKKERKRKNNERTKETRACVGYLI